MTDHVHDQTITETRLRTFLRNLSGSLVQILIDVLILNYLFKWLGLTLASLSIGGILIELICFGTSYLVDRLWNRLQWGRKVYCKQCKERKCERK